MASSRVKPFVETSGWRYCYIENDDGTMLGYGQRHRAGKPNFTSRAEGTVN